MVVIDKGILIVEDEPNTCKNLSGILAAKGFTEVYTSGSYFECISILSEHGENIYVVLLDVQLPDGYGLDLMKHLINSHEYIVGVIVVTAYGDVDMAIEFLHSGTDQIVPAAFQQKPIRTDNLLEQINRTINLIETKRRKQSPFIQGKLLSNLEEINLQLTKLNSIVKKLDRIDGIEERLNALEKKAPSFLKDLGLDIIRLVIIGLAVLAFLYLDFGNALVEIIEKTR